MTPLGNKADYLFEFEAEGLNLLFSDMVMQTYGPAGAIEIYDDGKLREYIHKKSLKLNTPIAEKLYGLEKNFNRYAQNLKNAFSNAASIYKSILKKPIEQKIVLDFFQETKNILDLYSKLDPLYTDGIYKQIKENKTILQNLKEIEKSKEKYREAINKLYLEKNNFIERLIVKLSKRFGIKPSYLYWYTIEELEKLFEGKKLPREESISRQIAFVQIYKNTKAINYFGAPAIQIVKQFDAAENKDNLIKGTVASRSNRSIVKGKVKVINIDYSDFALMNKKIQEMEKGDVLVAQSTAPELMTAIHKAAAIVTDVGGLLSHAAIVSREFNIPCIVGTETASKVLKDGDYIEVNTETGIIKKISPS